MQKKRADSFESARFFWGGIFYSLKSESNSHQKSLICVVIVHR